MSRSYTYAGRDAAKNTKKIAEYIANQLKEDKMVEQMSMSELLDPFKQ